MTSVAWAALLTLIEEAITQAPALLVDVEALIARLKTPSAGSLAAGSLAAGVASDTATLASELTAAVKP